LTRKHTLRMLSYVLKTKNIQLNWNSFLLILSSYFRIENKQNISWKRIIIMFLFNTKETTICVWLVDMFVLDQLRFHYHSLPTIWPALFFCMSHNSYIYRCFKLKKNESTHCRRRMYVKIKVYYRGYIYIYTYIHTWLRSDFVWS